MNKFYRSIRSLHLYFGLIISPFIIVFSISIWVFNHPYFFSRWREEPQEPVHAQVNYQAGETDLITARNILSQLHIDGEVDWISKSDSIILFPVNKPGASLRVTVNIHTGESAIVKKSEGLLNGMGYLHSMPGPHNAMLRGNSFFMKTWRATADGLVYLVLFVSSSGIFLWYFLRPERKFGLYSFGVGAVLFILLMVLLTR